MEEMVFNSYDEACQKLADITGMRVSIPDKAEAKIAQDIDFDAEIEKHEEAADQIKKIKEQYDSAMEKVRSITE